MPAPTGTRDTMSKLCGVAWIAGIALSTLVAVGVAALFLALLGAARTSSAPRQQSSAAAPLIQSRGTGARPQQLAPKPAQPVVTRRRPDEPKISTARFHKDPDHNRREFSRCPRSARPTPRTSGRSPDIGPRNFAFGLVLRLRSTGAWTCPLLLGRPPCLNASTRSSASVRRCERWGSARG
jgi:hypothetical protein